MRTSRLDFLIAKHIVENIAKSNGISLFQPRKIIDKLEKSEIYTLPASDQLKVRIVSCC